jgi:hypothetical protein
VFILNGWLFGCLREAVVASVIAENGSPFKRRTSKEEHLQITLNRWKLFQELFPEAPIPESDTIIDMCIYLHWATKRYSPSSSSPWSTPVELDEETLKEIWEKEKVLLQKLSDSAGMIDKRPLSAILHSLSQPESNQLLVFEAILVMSWIKNTSVATTPLGSGLTSGSNILGRIDLISVKRIGMSLESGPSLALRSAFLEKGVVSNSDDLQILTSGKNIEIYFTSSTGCTDKVG